MSSRYDQMVSLYGPEEARNMERIRDLLLADPTALDNRKENAHGTQGTIHPGDAEK